MVRKRVAALASHRGLPLAQMDLQVITAARLRLDQRDHLARLFETARRLRPKLLLLDPLVRLHGIDENNASDVSKLLSGLRHLQRRLDLAVALVHHTRKSIPPGMAAGQGLRGSTDLHAFGDSNLYLRRQRGRLVLSMEHRAAAAPDPVGLELVTADEQTIHLEVTQQVASDNDQGQDPPLDEAVVKVLQSQPGITRQALRQQLAVKNERLGQALTRLQRRGRIERGCDGWSTTGGCDARSVPGSPL